MGEKSDLQSSEVKNIINSFTISNYKNPEKSSFFSLNVWSKIIAITIVAIIGVTIKYFVDKGKENEIDIHNQTNKIIKDNDNTKQNKIFYSKCGEEIEKDWHFCNNCGNKLK